MNVKRSCRVHRRKIGLIRAVLLAGLASMGLAASACLDADSDPVDDPDRDSAQIQRVILISIDTLRADHVGFMGHDAGTTPSLDALAESGTVFSTTLSPAPLTLPAHATLLTGLNPPAHGVHHNGLFSLDESIPTLGSRLRNRGFETAAFVGAVVLDRRYGLAAGFDHYDDAIDGDQGLSRAFSERSAEQVVDRALAWMGSSEGSFFAWLHLYDPHLPWQPPASFLERFPDPYLAEIAYADAQIGRLVEHVETRWPDGGTLWIVTSDHGESLGQHGERSHAYSIYEATQRVPLVMRGPGIPNHARSDNLAGLADIMPTILARLNPGPDPQTDRPLDGRDLLADRDAKNDPRSAYAYAETRATEYDHGWSSIYSIRDDRFHFIRAPRRELYDVQSDPDELHDLAESEPARVREMEARLAERLAIVSAPSVSQDLPASDRERLAALGYLPNPNARVRPLGEVGGTSPSEGLAEANRWLRGRQLIANGRSRAAFRILCEMPARSPLVNLDCARAALSMGDVTTAEGRARAALGAHPDAERVIAEVLLLQREYDEAEARLARLSKKDPDSGAVLTALGRVAAAQGDVDRALELYRRASTTRQPSYEGLVMASALLFRERRIEEARALFEHIEARDIILPDSAAELVAALYAAGEVDSAGRLLGQALDRYPDADVLEQWLAPELGIAKEKHALIRGRRLLELGKPDQAYRVLTSVEADSPVAQLDRAWAAARSGRISEAKSFVEQSGRNRWRDLTLAEILIRNAEWDAAEELISELQSEGIRYSNLTTMLGRIAEGRGQTERAIEIYREAIESDSPSLEAHWRWAALEIEAGRRERAERALAGFHRVDPYANARLVEAELAAGAVEQARQRLMDALTRHPDAEALIALESRIEGALRAN